MLADASGSACDAAPPARVVIFAARRTGSSMLVELLRAHPQMLMHGELFHVRMEELRGPDGYVGRTLPDDETFERRRREPAKLLRHLQCHADGRAAVGLKVFRDHTRPDRWPVLTEWCTVCVVLRRADVRARRSRSGQSRRA